MLALVLTGSLSSSAAGSDPGAIDALAWVHPDEDAVAFLTSRPPECVSAPGDAETLQLIDLGRVAFRSPVLLGGLAARVGLSCDGCHRNGHDHPAFHIEGVSGAAGTADVTGSVFSTRREDELDNPVAIPSLVDAAKRPPFGTIRPLESLAGFVRAAIVEEFEGQPPSARVLAALVAYLEALDSRACPSAKSVDVTFEADVAHLRRTLEVARVELVRGRTHEADFVLRALRFELGRLFARFPPGVAGRDALPGLSAELDPSRREGPRLAEAGADARLERWRSRFDAVAESLAVQTHRSYYDAAQLRRVLARKR